MKHIPTLLGKHRNWLSAEDFIPTEEYDIEDADLAISNAEFVLNAVRKAFDKP